MENDFDLLGGSNVQETKPEEAQVNWDSVVDQMKTKLSNESDPTSRDKILNATLDTIVDMANSDKTSLLDAIKALTDYQDEVGLQFESFSSLNDKEQSHIDNANNALKLAQKALIDAEAKEDTWWNNLWGRQSKINLAKQQVEAAEKVAKLAPNEAKAMFQVRIDQASIEVLLKQLQHKSSAAVERLRSREVEIKEVERDLKVAITEASKNHELALQKKAETEEDLNEAKAEMNQARTAIEEITDKQSVAYSEALSQVTKTEQKVEELSGLLQAYITLAASKDSFVHKHNLTIKVLTSLRSNLQTHRAKLKSDTEERVKYYEGYSVALKARTDQEFASILEKLGVKTDEHIGETLAAMHTASGKARQEMMENIPVHEKVMQGIYKSYAEGLFEIREKDAEIKKDFEGRFGINMDEAFEEFYAAKKVVVPNEEETTTKKEEVKKDDLLS